MKLTLNNKTYDVPELTFKHFRKMEEHGLSIVDGDIDKKLLEAVAVYVCIVVDCDIKEADRLIEQHILGGGSFTDIVNSFIENLNNSHFFQKMLEKNPATKQTNKGQQKAKNQRRQ